MGNNKITNTNFIFFCLTRPRLVPTIYRTRGEHASHYATDAVLYFYLIFIYQNFLLKEKEQRLVDSESE
jgi:hypothetical protein